MKRGMLVLSLVMLFASLSSFMVSAYTFPINDLSQTSSNIIQAGKDMLSPILEFLLGVNSFDQYFFQRTLLLVLIYVVVFVVLKRIDIFKRNRVIMIIVAAIVSILGARYMSEVQLIEGVLLPYGTFAIALTMLLPFIIYFFFVHNAISSPGGRRMAWILFAAVFFGLWFTRRADVGSAGWIYLIGIAAVAISFLFDETIHQYFGLSQAKEAKRNRIKMQIADIEARLNNLRNIPNPSRATEDTIRMLEERINDLSRKL